MVLARDGGKLLQLAMEAYRATEANLSSFDRDHLVDVFQKQGGPFLTSRMRDRAALVDRYRLQGWS